MSGIRSYDLSGDQVAEVILALEGNEELRLCWLGRMRKWVGARNTKMEILTLAEKWYREFGLKTGVHLGRHDWETDQENLTDWVYYMMEYSSCLTWDEATRSVVINKYASSRLLLNEENTAALLDFLTKEMRAVTT